MGVLLFSDSFPKTVTRYDEFRDWLDDNQPINFCAYCLRTHSYSEIDHFLPKQFFSKLTNDPDNLLLACAACNKAKGGYFKGRKYKKKKAEYEIPNVRRDDLAHYLTFDLVTGNVSPKPIPEAQNFWKVVGLDRRKGFQNDFKDFAESYRELIDLWEIFDESGGLDAGVGAHIKSLLRDFKRHLLLLVVLEIAIDPKILELLRRVERVQLPKCRSISIVGKILLP